MRYGFLFFLQAGNELVGEADRWDRRLQSGH